MEWYLSVLSDQDFIKELSICASFIHGTHVASIALNNHPEIKIMNLKLLGSGGSRSPFRENFKANMEDSSKRKRLLSRVFDRVKFGILAVSTEVLAAQLMNLYRDVVTYADNQGVSILNLSFGIPSDSLRKMIQNLFDSLKIKSTKTNVEDLVNYMFSTLNKRGRNLMNSFNHMIFVQAAGNSSQDIASHPIFPATVGVDNMIVVGATIGQRDWAPFSNFSSDLVDVAAPGVSITAATPGNSYLAVSGTSQSAPFVAHLVARIKLVNPELTPKQIRIIIRDTSNRHSFLEGRVRSQGIIDIKRAVFAARRAKESSLGEALTQSWQQFAPVSDEQEFSFLSAPVFGVDLIWTPSLNLLDKI